MTYSKLASVLACGVCIVAMATPAHAQTRTYNIPAGSLKSALDAYGRQSGRPIIYKADQIRGLRSRGVSGSMSSDAALDAILAGTPFRGQADSSGAVAIVRVGNGTADATQDASSSGDGAANNEQYGEIVVTAQKRTERLLDTPQSVSVLSSKDLSRLNALQFRDFASTVPGLNFTTFGAGQNQVSLRGVTAGADFSSTVGIYVDETPYGSSSAFARGPQLSLDVGLFDIERIEVLRGPQGTLYGASSLGGLIKYVTKRPDASRFSLDAQAGVSDTRYGGTSFHGSAAINAPLATDKAALRVSGFYSHDGGFVDNLALGQADVNRSNVYGGRADLLLTPTEALSIRLTGFAQNISRRGQGQVDYTFTSSPVDNDLAQRRLIEEPFKQHFRLISSTIDYDFGTAKLTSVTSYQSVRTTSILDSSTLYVPILGPIFGGPYSSVGASGYFATKKFVQELRLGSQDTQPLEWVVGGYYTHEKSTNETAFILRDLTGAVVPNTLYAQNAPSRYTEYAVFGDLTYHFSPKFDVTAGARYARNRQAYSQDGSGLFAAIRPTRRSKEGVMTYLANARYHFSDHTTAYLRYASGYRSGGPNAVLNDPGTGVPLAPDTFSADRLHSYEAGFKAQTADRQFGFDLSAYYIDWNNIQIAVVRNGFGIIGNAPGGASVRGAELTLTANPIPGLTATGAFAYQDAHLSAANADVGGAKGERLPNVPRFTAATTIDYTMVDLPIKPAIGATLRFVSDRWASFDGSVGSPQFHIPDYVSVDLRAGFEVKPATIQLFVRNLFDVRSKLSAFTDLGQPRYAIGQPRTIGLNATTRF